MTNVRIVSSQVYTQNFTPSTSPLTAISGTQLLLLAGDSGSLLYDSSTNSLSATNLGTVYSSTSPFTAPPLAWPVSVNLQGPTGQQGPTGVKGSTGFQGTTGFQGSTGAQGSQGNQGVQGAADKYATTTTSAFSLALGSTSLTVASGLAWTTGMDCVIAYDVFNIAYATVNSYSTSTLSVTVNKFITNNNISINPTWVINVDGVIGVKGDTGAQGLTGPQGFTGSQAVSYTHLTLPTKRIV